jgi:hypothetical protein
MRTEENHDIGKEEEKGVRFPPLVKAEVGEYTLRFSSGASVTLGEDDVSLDLGEGVSQPSALGKVKTLLKVVAVGAGMSLAPLAGSMPEFKHDAKALGVLSKGFADVPVVEATEILSPARIHFLIDLAKEWKEAYNAEFEEKVKSHLQEGKSIEEAASLAEEEMEEELNDKYSADQVNWDIVILSTKREGNTYEVTIDPKITDLKYKETPYPVGSPDYPEGGLEHLVYHVYGLEGGRLEGETCYDICYDSCYTPPPTEPPGCYDVCYTPQRRRQLLRLIRKAATAPAMMSATPCATPPPSPLISRNLRIFIGGAGTWWGIISRGLGISCIETQVEKLKG